MALPYQPLDFDITSWTIIFDLPEKPGFMMKGEAILPRNFVNRPEIAIEEIRKQSEDLKKARIYIIHVGGTGYFLSKDGGEIDFEFRRDKIGFMSEMEAANTIIEEAVGGKAVVHRAVEELAQQLAPTITLGSVAKIEQGLPGADFWMLGNVPIEMVGKPVSEHSPHNLGIRIENTDVLVPQYLIMVINNLWEKEIFRTIAQGAGDSYYVPAEAMQSMPMMMAQE